MAGKILEGERGDNKEKKTKQASHNLDKFKINL